MEQTSELEQASKRTYDIIHDKVWNELCHANKESYYLSYYLRDLRTIKKRLRLFLVIVSLGGLICEIWFPKSSLYVLIFITLFEIFKEIIPKISVDDNLIDKLPQYINLQNQKYQQLELLFHKIQVKTIKIDQAEKSYFKIKEILDPRISEMDNEMHLTEKKKLYEKADKTSKIYLSNIFECEES